MKKKTILKKVPLISIMFGVVILLIGFYYEGVKAGIPYQDPTPELTQKYLNNIYTGHTLYKIGFIMISIGCLLFMIQRIINKFSKGSN